MAITDYKTISEGTTNELSAAVQEAISAGWQPFGHQYAHGNLYSQAVVKGTPDDFSPGTAVADATDAPSAVDRLNDLLASLRAAGILASA